MLVAALVPLSPRQLSLWGSPTRYVAWINRTTSRPGGWSPRPAWGGRGGSLGPRRGRGPQPSPTGRPHRIVPAEETLPRRLPPPAERSSERRVASRPVLSCPVLSHLTCRPPPDPRHCRRHRDDPAPEAEDHGGVKGQVHGGGGSGAAAGAAAGGAGGRGRREQVRPGRLRGETLLARPYRACCPL